MAKSWSSLLGLVLTLTTLSTLLSLVPYTSAQAPNPIPTPNLIPTSVQEMAFTRAGSKLYINGGRVSKNGTNMLTSGQFFSLDLSQTWDVNSAPWQALPSTAAKYAISMVASPDNKTLYTLQRNGTDNSVWLTNFNIGTNAWDSRVVTIPASNYEDRQGMKSIMDPNTWTIYMNSATNLDIYNLNVSTLSIRPLWTPVLTNGYFGGGVYNKLRNSLMYFGGWAFKNGTVQFDPLATYVSEYSLTAQTWANISTTGTPPPVRSDFCMAVNDDGSKVVVYGGRVVGNNVFAGTFFILDVTTGQWTQGPDGDVRSYMACIIVGDQFLAWGGSPGNTTWDTPPRIFDMTLLKWTTSYKAPAYYLNTPKSSSTTPSPSSTTLPNAGVKGPPSSSSNNLGAILGGTFGGLFVLASAGLIFVCLKRKEDRIKYGKPSEQQQQQNRSRDFNNDSNTNGAYGNVKERQKEYESAAMLPTSESQLRNPQKVGAQASMRDPQDYSGLGYHSPMMSTTGGYTPYAQSMQLQQHPDYTHTQGSGFFQQQQHQQQFRSSQVPELGHFTATPKEAQTASAAMFAVSPTTASSLSTAYVPKSSYSAPAAVVIPPVPKSTVTSPPLSPPVFSNSQQSTAFGSSTELSQQQFDVYRAQYHPSTTGTATPDGSSTVAGSPANSDSLVYTTAPMGPNTFPPHAYNNNAYSVPVMQNPASIATSFSGASAPVNMAAFVPPPPPPSNPSPMVSTQAYNHYNRSGVPSPIAISGIIYASSPTTSQVSPALPSSAGQQTPVTAHRDFSDPVTSTVSVRVPDTVPEDQYLNYVLAQQQQQHGHENVTSPTTPNPPSSLPQRPTMQPRFSSTTASNLAAAAPGFENVPDNTQEVNHAQFAEPTNSSGYSRPAIAPPQ
ncbi:hypothetical protein BGZ83_005901 [Gryganskiella cystojenkinii]|nr:hypothetical protein BGZ83_005901 [Gryganskiella cystojenkinii]